MKSKGKFDVAIIIGSESDKKIIEESGMLDILSDCKIKWELSIISAHRNPTVLAEYCRNALFSRDVKIFIAAAGLAAHLPGAIVSYIDRACPVIGVALPSQEYPDAQDALLSITRMPSGYPVAFAGVGKTGLKNAAVLACQILSLINDEIAHEFRGVYLLK